jgi:hypothetical protein
VSNRNNNGSKSTTVGGNKGDKKVDMWTKSGGNKLDVSTVSENNKKRETVGGAVHKNKKTTSVSTAGRSVPALKPISSLNAAAAGIGVVEVGSVKRLRLSQVIDNLFTNGVNKKSSGGGGGGGGSSSSRVSAARTSPRHQPRYVHGDVPESFSKLIPEVQNTGREFYV